VVAAIEAVADWLPYPMVGLDCDNGGEFFNHAMIARCAQRTIFVTRARAHTSKDNAHVEQKNGDIVRKSAFRYRYDTPEELEEHQAPSQRRSQAGFVGDADRHRLQVLYAQINRADLTRNINRIQRALILILCAINTSIALT